MDRQQLFEQIKEKKSFLCIGLDTDITKIPAHLRNKRDFSGMLAFNKGIVSSTHDLAVAYKPNLAFYESLGHFGWEVLEETVQYIRNIDPNIFVIADGKRGDIGNTSAMYAEGIFNMLKADAATVAPYMGEDSVSPFLAYPNKWTILLALTSNKGANDFQYIEDIVNGEVLYEKVLKRSQEWGTIENMMYVVGATKADKLAEIREIVPEHFLLVPGIGAQGGSLQEVAKYGMNSQCGLLVNSSRQIIYASDGTDFAEKARKESIKVQTEMSRLLKDAGLI